MYRRQSFYSAVYSSLMKFLTFYQLTKIKFDLKLLEVGLTRMGAFHVVAIWPWSFVEAIAVETNAVERINTELHYGYS